MTTSFGAAEVCEIVAAFADGLECHQATLNRLNVFPVPDGDTGTNMLATVRAARAALEGLGASAEPEMDAVCEAIASASLMGARGNSGVIVCQILRGLATAWSGRSSVDAGALAAALDEGAREARKAVQRPAEGTILTVATAAAGAARSAVRSAVGEVQLADVVRATLAAGIAALWSTPELLPVLADAGVVDAGGAGLLLLYDALAQVLTGSEPLGELPLPTRVREMLASLGPAIEARASAVEGALRYEVMFLLETAEGAVQAFRDAWAAIGDSIVVVGGDGLWNCHIHTDEIGPAIEAALDVGRPREIRVTDLAEQVEEERWVREAATLPREASSPEKVATAVVAVASGDGIARILFSLGVSRVLRGGQSMNPSTAELLEAIEEVGGDEVVVLPNNSNIYPVARQAAALSEKPVVVLETPGIQEAFAALLDYDPKAPSAANAPAMAASAARVRAGEVTQAMRATSSAAGPVGPGDWIALDREGIVGVAGDPATAACALLEVLVAEGCEIVTVIEGIGATEAGNRTITAWLAAHHPELVLERHRGGQPLYPYLVAVE